jgi:hypothetical protein
MRSGNLGGDSVKCSATSLFAIPGAATAGIIRFLGIRAQSQAASFVLETVECRLPRDAAMSWLYSVTHAHG